MAISKIGNLFAANVDSLSSYTKNKQTSSETQAAAGTPSASSEAAVVSTSFAQNRSQETDSSRRDKVADLKSQVSKGTYKPDSKQVAVAVLRDLA